MAARLSGAEELGDRDGAGDEAEEPGDVLRAGRQGGEQRLHLRGRGRLEVGEAGGQLVHRQDGGVAVGLVAGQLDVEVAAEAGVDGLGEALGVAEGVEHALGRDRVLVVAGVADQRPAGPGALAEEAVGQAGEPEPLDPLGAVDPGGEVRDLEQRLEEGLLDPSAGSGAPRRRAPARRRR